ncbi:MAG TPA: hypothetical protein VFA74_13160 [Terriglobales bacterium]|nr:hypothetical protein [Terriglobales bacterium]
MANHFLKTLSSEPKIFLGCVALILSAIACTSNLQAREKEKKPDYGFGLSMEIPAPESEVVDAVEDVVNDGIIQGSKEYNKDQYIESATAVQSSPLFPKWTGAGKVFYKVRTGVLAPVNFKDTGDQGTLAVRYVVEPKDDSKTTIRIDAIFVEDFRRIVHPSSGSVESSEFKDIQDHIDAMHLKQKQAAEQEKHHQDDLAKQVLARPKETQDVSRLVAAETSSQTLEQRVQDLRRQVERLVKVPGAPLKSAPFHTASTLKPLTAGTEVVILITTPYWYGVETTEGQHGWIFRDELEQLP